jgi:hypothetical protein
LSEEKVVPARPVRLTLMERQAKETAERKAAMEAKKAA